MTEADREAEAAIRTEIGARFPDHANLGEELGLTGSGRSQWVLDPVNGTCPFMCGLLVRTTLIGLMIDGRAVLRMMSRPSTCQRFRADRDSAWTERDGARQQLATRARKLAAAGPTGCCLNERTAAASLNGPKPLTNIHYNDAGEYQAHADNSSSAELADP